jgi:transglutaminase-like putative cysteine protease
MKLSISHDTQYHYSEQVLASIQYLRLTPQDSARQRIIDWTLGLPRAAKPQLDPYGNVLHVLCLEEPHDQILIRARGEVQIDAACEAEPSSQSALPFLRSTDLTLADPALREFAWQHTQDRADREHLSQLMHALADRMIYTPGSTRVDTPAAESFASGAGVCQDHTHAFLACARSIGVPARYVSGYLCTEDSNHLASHAWAEAWLDDAWYSFDVTNALIRPDRHLKLAVGLDYLDACPVRGVRRGGGCERMHAEVLVSPMQMRQQ